MELLPFFDALKKMLCFPDLRKLDEWKTLIQNDLTGQEWLETSSSSDTNEENSESDSDSESGEEQSQMEVDSLQ
jgi:hypothetical protein